MPNCLSAAVYGQDVEEVWQVSTADTFREGTNDGTSVIDQWGGAVRVYLPLVNTVQDELTSRVPARMRDYAGRRNSSGMLVQTFSDPEWIYARVLDANDVVLADSLRANDMRCGSGTRCSHGYSDAAVLDDGTFMVAWRVEIDGIGHRTRAQVFGPDYQKVGANISSLRYVKNQIGSSPGVFALSDSLHFWVLHTVGAWDTPRRVLVERFAATGEPVGDPVYLNPPGDAEKESSLDTAQLTDGSLVATWIGRSRPDSGSNDVVLRRYSRDLRPITNMLKVNDDPEPNSQYDATVGIATDGTYLIAWRDFRLSDGYPYTISVFGQFFDANDWRIGPNIRLNAGTEIESLYPVVEYSPDVYDVYWTSRNAGNVPYHTLHGTWEIEPRFDGVYTSRVFDPGSADAVLLGMDCIADQSPSSTVGIQIRLGRTMEELETSEWRAPSTALIGTFDACTEGIPFNPAISETRFVQFRARFMTSDYARSPILKEVGIRYSVPAVLSFEGIEDARTERVSFDPPYPNPAAGAVIFLFSLPQALRVNLSVFDSSGRLVDIVLSDVESGGISRIVWSVRGQAPGTYFARLRAGRDVRIRSFVIVPFNPD